MPHFHRSTCKVCGRSGAEVGRISATGLCPEHGEERHLEHNRQLREHRGPWFEHWRLRSIAALGAVPATPALPDPRPPSRLAR